MREIMCKLLGFRENKFRTEGFSQSRIENSFAHGCPMSFSLIPEVLLLRLFMMMMLFD
jgi:hypothetical protein